MIRGKTKSGFKFKINERVLNDYELIELLAEVEENPLLVTKVLTTVLGDDKQRLIEHVREEDGIVPVDAMMEEIAEIFNASNEGKNS